MKNSFLFIKCVIVFLAIAAFSCKKRDFGHLSNIDAKDASSKSYTKSSSRVASSGSCVEDTGDPSAYDSILVPTILGYHLVNHPYSLAHMQQAYINLYGTASGVAVTNNYVRFKPSTPEQLSVLEDLDIDLFDHPLDYDVIQDGDYYDDGVTPAEEIPWLYAVVDINFTPPPGITYEVLEQIHIPILAAVENEAFALTGNPYDDPNCVASGASIQNTQTQTIICQKQRCPEGYIWDPGLCKCVLNTNCPVGYHWDGSTCVPDGPPPPTPSRQPSGTITVTDNNNGNITHRGVRNARVIAKRFFKVERTFTNNNGEFFLTKEFNKVHLFAEFENEQARIRSLRTAKLWQMLTPVERDFGKFKGSLNNLQLNIEFNDDAQSRLARYWAAATAHNTVQEYRDFTALQQIGNPPNQLKILLTNWAAQGSSGATPMFAKRGLGVPPDFVTRFIVSNLNLVSGGMSAIILYLRAQVDVTAGYNEGDITINSDRLSETMFHEQTHAAHYNKVGNAWWSNLVNAELAEMIVGPSPYGTGLTANSPIIALGESWGYHIGHFATDWKYAGVTAPVSEQSVWYFNNTPVNGLSSRLNLLENFDPNSAFDVFAWIPQGLYYDLIDNRNEFTPVIDGVLGFDNRQFFDALDADVVSVTQFRDRLIVENPNNQTNQVLALFNQYHY